MEGAALITDPPPLGVYPDRIEFTQDTAAFAAHADNGLKTISAKEVLCSVFRVFPFGNVFRLITQITPFHPGPFFSPTRKNRMLLYHFGEVEFSPSGLPCPPAPPLAKASWRVVSLKVNFSSFKRPSRYINGEVNSVHRQAPVRVALAFPDIYDVGMSHLGLKVLYKIINDIPYAVAERVFSPWPDLEEEMKKRGILLSSLETRIPLKDFDIVGFSLQYELCYTTVLNMLHLGGVPIRSQERFQGKSGPLVIAGGPCTLNPHPMSAFVDAFLIGDGEDAIAEIISAYHEWKKEGSDDRGPLLKALAGIEGIFVPVFGKESPVKRRILSSLENAPFPDNPVLPFTSIIHDRINIEISRGCSMGCRFCQAGMACRPVRERSPGKILALAAESLRNTGYEDISFTSLSSGDYSCLPLLMREFNKRFYGKRIAISLPSLRVASVNDAILREIRTVRKTGFTIAPEAGTDRLRAVINKDVSGEAYMRALETLFKEGWNNLKLYFMTGLPTEREEDIAAIPDMVFEAIKVSKRLTGKHVNISVGVSSFVPKPHTPFQWFAQDRRDVLKEKNNYLKRAFLKRGVKYKGHSEEMSLLEAIFARGDESLAPLIENAWSLGCRLDAWTEVFDFGKWERAMEVSNIDAEAFALRAYEVDARLPWDNIQTGVTAEYLRREYRNALAGSFTVDCRKRCHNCGLKCRADSGDAETERLLTLRSVADAGTVSVGNASQRNDPLSVLRGAQRSGETSVRARLQYSKTGNVRYLSHLELTKAIMRAMRRANFPLKYSSGFHPSPRVSFGPALGVGIAGLSEYLDLELIAPVEIDALTANLKLTMPQGIGVERMAVLFGKEKSLDSFVMRYTYEIIGDEEISIEGFLEKDEALILREKGSVDLKELVEAIEKVDCRTVRLTVRDQGAVKVRLDELLTEIFGEASGGLSVTRTAMYGWDGGWVKPMEGEELWAAKS
jgi:radical SAM family uncharacterized protein/radical SAM-linked protein